MSNTNLKLKQYSSNKSIYFQSLLGNKVLFSKKELIIDNINLPLSYKDFKKSHEKIAKNDILAINLINFYNEKKIKYNTLQYLLSQNKLKTKSLKVDLAKNLTQLSIEYSIESGLISY